MNTFQIDIPKLKSVVLYIIERLGEVDFHKAFKIMYFADREHLAKYGRQITGDVYIAMKYGPVPSFTYDVFKAIRGDGYYSKELKTLYGSFEIIGDSVVKGMGKADMDELSVSDLECLNKAIEENKELTFPQLSKKSHDGAYNAVQRDESLNLIDIATAGHANEEMIQYIRETQENRHISLLQ